MGSIRRAGAVALILGVFFAPSAAEASSAKVAAMQSGLQSLQLYDGYVDGIVALQRRRGLAVDGVFGPRTRRALGWRGRPGLGSRPMRFGNRGWDVAGLQYLLQRAGSGAGRADGIFGPLTEAAVKRAQAGAGIAVDGVAGAETLRALRGGGAGSGSAPSGPVRFLRPLAGPTGDGFGVNRGDHLHSGIDFPVPEGTPVGAAGVGSVIFAGYNSGGYGNLVVVQHRLGYTSWYAHLSSIAVSSGQAVNGGTRIGYVGSTGNSTGPHLHFEVRRYDTPIDPAPLLLATVAGRVMTPARRAPSGGCDEVKRVPRGSAGRGDWIAVERLCAER
jgi:hypothetical protein